MGDVNADGEVNIADVTRIIDLILGGQADAALLARADVNTDGEVKIADVTALISYLLSNNW